MFPEVTVRGCAFHWTQAVVRHIKSVGLWTSYQQENKVGVVLRDLLCLKYVPAEQTEATAASTTRSLLRTYRLHETYMVSTLEANRLVCLHVGESDDKYGRRLAQQSA